MQIRLSVGNVRYFRKGQGSYTAPVSDMVPPDEAVRICRQTNDILAQIIQKYPERFAAFATLPMDSPDDAAKKLERCV